MDLYDIAVAKSLAGGGGGSGDLFLVTMHWDASFGDGGGFVPDKTWAEIESAYADGKKFCVDVTVPDYLIYSASSVQPTETDGVLTEVVYTVVFFDGESDKSYFDAYTMGADLYELMGRDLIAYPMGTFNITKNGSYNVTNYEWVEVNV